MFILLIPETLKNSLESMAFLHSIYIAVFCLYLLIMEGTVLVL